MASPEPSTPPTATVSTGGNRLAILSVVLALAAVGGAALAFGLLDAATNQGYSTVAPNTTPPPNLTLAWSVYWGGLVAGVGAIVIGRLAQMRVKQHAREHARTGLATLGLLIGVVCVVALVCGGAWYTFTLSLCGHGC